MNKTLSLLLTLSLFIVACGQNAQNQNVYKFGAVFPITGDNNFYGEFAKYGMQLAIEDLNKQGGVNGRQVVGIYEDSGGNKAQANSAAQKLIGEDHVDALFTVTTPMAGVIAPMAEESKIPFIYVSATNSFTENKSYVFKDYIDATKTCKLLMQKALADGHTKIALFGTNAEFTFLCKEGTDQVAPVASYELYNAGETDFRSNFVKILNSGATAVILSVFANDCPNVFQQMTELGYKPQLYIGFQGFGCGSPQNTLKYAQILPGSYGGDLLIDQTTPEYQQFFARLQARDWMTQPVGSALHYDSVMEIAKAYQGCMDKKCAVDNLRKLDMNGLSGQIHYNGQVVDRELTLTKYDNGTWVNAQ